jgi:hypothetical protein
VHRVQVLQFDFPHRDLMHFIEDTCKQESLQDHIVLRGAMKLNAGGDR